jgi:hypothetical protein
MGSLMNITCHGGGQIGGAELIDGEVGAEKKEKESESWVELTEEEVVVYTTYGAILAASVCLLWMMRFYLLLWSVSLLLLYVSSSSSSSSSASHRCCSCSCSCSRRSSYQLLPTTSYRYTYPAAF